MLIANDPSLNASADVSTVQEALEYVETSPIDLALVDIHLSDGNGFDLCQRLKAINPAIKVIFITALHEQLIAGWALQFGADGMICKDVEPKEILTVIKKSIRGEPAFHPRAYQWLMSSLRGELSEGLYTLSQREMTVLCQISQGKNSKETASELKLSPRTIETHNRNIREKLKIPHHDALVQVATLLLGHGGGHSQVNREVRLLASFESATLSPTEWDHKAHLTVAFLYLSRLPFNHAHSLLCKGIQRLNLTHGKDKAFHATTTYAYSVLVKSILGRQPVWMTARDFIEAHPELMGADPLEPLLGYYSLELISSDQARSSIVDPDLCQLPAL